MSEYVEAGDQESVLLLGLIMREAANVELRLRVIAANLLDSPHAELITGGLSVGDLRQHCKALAEASPLVNPTKEAELKGLLQQATDAFQRRNHYAHGVWAIDIVTMERSALLSRRWRDVLIPAPVTEQELRALRLDLASLNHDLASSLLSVVKTVKAPRSA
ncbi:hypothetical protein [Streptomyces lavendulocolor]|uniref:hypothetical protein n=1 Tax=Streptomyces lavendulocolor TaxID=67316 RepID=UPI0033C02F1C